VKRTIGVLALIALGVVAAALTKQSAARQRDYRALLLGGDVALRDERTSDAIEAYSGAIALRPESMLAYLRRGETYRRSPDRADLEAAARDFRKAASLDHSAPRPLEELGDVTYQSERYDQAVKAYEASARLDDHAPRINYKLALARYRSEDLDGTLAALDEAVRLDDRMAEAYYLMGVCLRDKGRLPEARVALEKAVTLSPGLIPAREELADTFGTLDRRTDQLDQLQLLAGLDRNRPARYVAVALTQARRHRWDTAVVTIGSALERAPEDPALYGTLGQVWFESAQARNDRVDLGKAREALERAASRPGASSDVLALSARAALEDGATDAAERLLKQATERFPIDPKALLLYANVAERQNHPDIARRALIQYDALVDDDTDPLERIVKIATLSARVDDTATASEWIHRGLTRDPANAQLLELDARLTAPSSDRSDRAGRRREN
jgi:tetratricopeptide (TPR) repeat protein